MSETESNDLRAEVLELARAVSSNTEALEQSEEQQEENRRLSRRANLNSIAAVVGAVVAVIAVVVAIVVGVRASNAAAEAKSAAEQAKAAQQAVTDAQVKNCQNANETRKGQASLWDFIIDTSIKSNPDAPEIVTKFYDDLRVYVHDLFAQRDCSDLTKTYDQPKAPDIPSLNDIKKSEAKS